MKKGIQPMEREREKLQKTIQRQNIDRKRVCWKIIFFFGYKSNCLDALIFFIHKAFVEHQDV